MFMFLAQTVAPVTSSSGSEVWSVWMTPQGLGAIAGLLTSLLAVLATILALLGKKDLANKVQVAHDELKDHKDQLAAAVDVIRSLVQGVEQAKGGLTPDARAHLVATIQDVATKMGGQQLLDPIVQAVQSGNVDAATLTKTLNDALTKLQGAAPAAPAA